MENYSYSELKDTRSGFGDALAILGQNNPKVVALCADLTGSLKMTKFAQQFPDRFFEVGIAEANMMGIAAGLATSGFIPFAGTFAVFAAGRAYDQVRLSIAYSNKNVKIAASHSGITVGEDGASHQMLEDIALMRALPNMVVINPCDYNQTKAATFAVADYYGPVYLRFGRPKVPNFTPENQKFEIGKAILMREGSDVTIFATGHMVWKALVAAQTLEQQGISAEVINIHTIKPIDLEAILESANKTRAVVTAEEHSIHGGLGDAVAQILANRLPTPMKYVAVNDTFGESGKADELTKKYGLEADDIVNAVFNVLKFKHR
jgi:transketolase